MATRKDENSITEIEQELAAIKSSLQELKGDNATPKKRQSITKSRTVTKRKVARKAATEVTESVKEFLVNARSARLADFEVLQNELQAATQRRKQEILAMKKACLQDEMARIKWLEELSNENEVTLHEFVGRLESQCEKERQDRLQLMDQIRSSLSELFGREV